LISHTAPDLGSADRVPSVDILACNDPKGTFRC
jgi:hypothetical protein